MKAVEEAARLARLAEATVGAMTRVRLKAKRRWGELLGPAEVGRPKENVTGGHVSEDADRKQVERARKLAAIPAEAFEAALENTEPENPPTETALLRMSARPDAETAPRGAAPQRIERPGVKPSGMVSDEAVANRNLCRDVTGCGESGYMIGTWTLVFRFRMGGIALPSRIMSPLL